MSAKPQAGTVFQQQAGKVAQAVATTAKNEAQKMAETAGEMMGVSQQSQYPEEAQAQPQDELEAYRAEVKQKEQEALANLRRILQEMQQASGERNQQEQVYQQNVVEQMQSQGPSQEEKMRAQREAFVPAAIKAKRGTREGVKRKG